MTTLICALFLLQNGTVTPPADFFGHPVGQDRTLFRYTRLVEYLDQVASESPRVHMQRLGKSTLGKDLVMAVVSTPDNLKEAARHRKIAQLLARGQGDPESLSKEGRAIVLFMLNLHSTEIMSSQTPAEMIYRLATGEAEGRWLEDVILLIVPSANPDGQEMIVDWYEKNLGTEFEGGPMPWLYHPYAGHDTNRDWFMFNLKETGPIADVMYREWSPQVIVDFHQMGQTRARFFIPPYKDPVHPDVHPLVWREVATISARIAQDFEEEGKPGVLSGEIFSSWFPSAGAKAPWWHNQVAILFEAASCRIATPIRVEKSETDTRQRQHLTHPWKGGWWHPRDIVEYQLTAGLSVLRTVSDMRSGFLRNMHRKAKQQMQKALEQGPFAFYVGPGSKDPAAVRRMLEVLKRGGISVSENAEPLTFDGRTLPEGTPIIFAAQPNYGYLRALLMDTEYPDWSPPPYDVSGWALPRMFGVRVGAIEGPFKVRLRPWTPREEKVRFEAGAWSPNPASTDVGTWVNRCFEAGVEIRRDRNGLLSAEFSDAETFEACRKDLALGLTARIPGPMSVPIRRPSIGIYKPWQASKDEGWLRWLFDTYGFEYRNLTPEDVSGGKLEGLDIIILPDAPRSVLVDGKRPPRDGEKDDKKEPERYPPEYRSGMKKEGVEAIDAWVRKGGTLITLGGGSELATSDLPIPVRNVLKGIKRSEFVSPGSVLRAEFDVDDPLCAGMEPGGSIFFRGGVAFQTTLPFGETDRRIAASFPEKEILQAGYLSGEKKISKRAVLVDADLGKGRVVLFAFSPHHRGQSFGTFKLLFNAIWSHSHR